MLFLFEDDSILHTKKNLKISLKTVSTNKWINSLKLKDIKIVDISVPEIKIFPQQPMEDRIYLGL